MGIQARLLLAGIVSLAVSLAAVPLAVHAASGYELEISKSERTLVVKRGAVITKTYPISGGRGGKGGKRFLGDHRTPVGVYRVMAVRDSDRFHRFMLLNYPGYKDAFWAYKNKVIDRTQLLEFADAERRGKLPPQDTRLGGAVGIHGIGSTDAEKLSIHRSSNWTEGCIALTNAQVDELISTYVDVGTKVVIRE